MRLYLAGTVRGGRIKWDNPAMTDRTVRSFEGKRVVVSVEKESRKRSNPQNRYYRGVVVPIVLSVLRGYGNDIDAEDAHEWLKLNFLPREIVDGATGQITTIGSTTTMLTTVGFIEYCERIQRYFAEHHGIDIPSPNEDIAFEIKDGKVSL